MQKSIERNLKCVLFSTPKLVVEKVVERNASGEPLSTYAFKKGVDRKVSLNVFLKSVERSSLDTQEKASR